MTGMGVPVKTAGVMIAFACVMALVSASSAAAAAEARLVGTVASCDPREPIPLSVPYELVGSVLICESPDHTTVAVTDLRSGMVIGASAVDSNGAAISALTREHDTAPSEVLRDTAVVAACYYTHCIAPGRTALFFAFNSAVASVSVAVDGGATASARAAVLLFNRFHPRSPGTALAGSILQCASAVGDLVTTSSPWPTPFTNAVGHALDCWNVRQAFADEGAARRVPSVSIRLARLADTYGGSALRDLLEVGLLKLRL
jgi:hypothetical protein